MLTQAEWDVLAPEEQEARQAEKPSSASEGKEDVVIIDGKPRPLKNFIAEISRKVKDEVMEEVAKKPAPTPSALPTDWMKRIDESAEKELAETGGIMPTKTIISVIGQGIQYQINLKKASDKILKETKKELKATYKDFSDFEDSFDEATTDIEPQYMSKEGLKIIFKSLRGDKMDEMEKKLRKEITEEVLADKKIIGDTGSPGKVSAPTKGIKLTPDQEKEKENMGYENSEDYLAQLEKKRQTAKSRGAKNTPQLIYEQLVF